MNRYEQAVSALASCDMVTSERIYEGGDLSESYGAFQKVLGLAEGLKLLELLGHQSPVVRGYVARHVARELPEYVERLLPLLRDITPVTTMSGCCMFKGSVADLVAEELVRSAHGYVIRRGLIELRRLDSPRKILKRVASQFPDEDDTEPGI